jgi:hypothetical protein
MDNFDLLNALLFFRYWVFKLFKAILLMMLVPFQIILGCFNMPIVDLIPYSRYLTLYRWNYLKTFGINLKITFNRTRPQIDVRSYDEEAEEASELFNKTKNKSIRTIITKGLEKCTKFTYVIFQTNNLGNAFILLRKDTGAYLFNFSLTPYSINSDFAIDIVDLFQAEGLHKTEPDKIYKTRTYTIEAQEDEVTIIQANLGTNKAFAVDFCVQVFNSIFRTTSIPEVIFG